jgi:hypothetical protein
MAHAYLAAPHIHVEQRCKKICYGHRKEALAALGRHNKKPGVTQSGLGIIGVYFCQPCGSFHIGHDRDRDQRFDHLTGKS